MADPLTPVLPPQASSIEDDVPISEVVALTETKIETPPTTPAPISPSPATPLPTSPAISDTSASKSPLFEDPDEIVVKRAL